MPTRSKINIHSRFRINHTSCQTEYELNELGPKLTLWAKPQFTLFCWYEITIISVCITNGLWLVSVLLSHIRIAKFYLDTQTADNLIIFIY